MEIRASLTTIYRSITIRFQQSELNDFKEYPLRLSEMKEGQTGVVERVNGIGPLRRRILEMGIVKGTELYVEKYAPLKDPLEIIVKGYHVSLRVEEASQITVDRVR